MYRENITIHMLKTNNGALVKYAQIVSQNNNGTTVSQRVMLYRLIPQQLQAARFVS
jgi:hypothetical protein